MSKIRFPSTNIIPEESVTRFRDEADRIEGSPEIMSALVDLIFGLALDDRPAS